MDGHFAWTGTACAGGLIAARGYGRGSTTCLRATDTSRNCGASKRGMLGNALLVLCLVLHHVLGRLVHVHVHVRHVLVHVYVHFHVYVHVHAGASGRRRLGHQGGQGLR